MNPGSMEFVGHGDDDDDNEPSEHLTEENVVPPERQFAFGVGRLADLQRQEQDAINFLNDLQRNDPVRESAREIQMYVALGRAKEAWQAWKQTRREYPLLYKIREDQADFIFGNLLHHFKQQMADAVDNMNGMAGRVYDYEVQKQVETLGRLDFEYQDFLAARKEHAEWKAMERFVARETAAREHALEALYFRARAEATQEQREDRAAAQPRATGIQGQAQRVKAQRPRFTPQAQVRQEHPHMQPRDKKGRFTESDSDSKGKGEL